MRKNELLQTITQSRIEFESLITRFRPEQMLLPLLPGGWSVKDVLAHVGWWEARAGQVINALLAGIEPAYALDESDVDGVNLRAYQENAALSLGDVRANETAAYARLLVLVQGLDDNVLEDPARFPWTGGRPLNVVVEWNTFGHYEEHRADLLKLLAE